MRVNFVLAAFALAAMGPGKSEPPPDVFVTTPSRDLQSGAETANAHSPEESALTPPVAIEPELPMQPAIGTAPADFQWKSRVVVVFADTPDDPAFVEQMRMLERRPAALIDRDVVVIADSDPSAGSSWRMTLHPRGFSLVLIDKDGQVKQRKPSPWDVREITRAIDKFPLRRQEMRRGDLGP